MNSPNPLLAEHQHRNSLSRDAWERFAPHRRRVTQLVLDQSPVGGGRALILGAGNCNDLDLPTLAERYDELHLLDWDAAAVEAAVARQLSAPGPTIKIWGGVDLTGIGEQLARYSPAAPPDADAVPPLVEQTVVRPFSAGGPPGTFRVVASVCLLSQLHDNVIRSLGEQHPQALALLLAVRARHLRQMAELVEPGGTVLLIADFVSSVTYPQLAEVPEAQLPGVVAGMLRNRNFFTGVNPLALEAFFRTDQQMAALVDDVRLSAPWIWDFGPRHYAVCAIQARRRSSPM